MQLRILRCRHLATLILWRLCHSPARSCRSQCRFGVSMHWCHWICCIIPGLLRSLGSIKMSAKFGEFFMTGEYLLEIKCPNSLSVFLFDYLIVPERVPDWFDSFCLPWRLEKNSSEWVAFRHWRALQCFGSRLTDSTISCCYMG